MTLQGCGGLTADDYRVRVTSPFVAARLGLVDDVMLPEETRTRLMGR